jgi:hypothetical protein
MRRTGCGGWLGLALALLAAGVTAVAVVIGVTLSRSPAPPDLSAFMRSVTVRSSEQAETGWITRKLGGLQAQARWLHPQGSSVVDGCSAVSGTGSGFMARPPLGVYCRRYVTAYYGFDGAVSARKVQLEQALRAEGATGFAACPPPGIMNPPPTAPPAVCGLWTLAATPPRFSNNVIDFSWIRHGLPVDPSITLGLISVKGQPARYRYYQYESADLRAIAGRAFRTHEYLLIVMIGNLYYNAVGGSSPPP